MRTITAANILITTLLMSVSVNAEVISASDTHFLLKLESTSALAPDDLWQRLINPASWWHPDHTFSGDANNLTLIAKAGGLWREAWSGGSVVHGRVMLVQTGRVLRMEAPFGPLQAAGAYVVWTISLKPEEEGTRVVFDLSAVGPAGAALDKLAGAVDGVKTEAISRLTQGEL